LSPDKHSKRKGSGFTERDQINVIMSVLGTPSEDDLSFVTDPTALNYIKEFPVDQAAEDFKKKFPFASDEALDLMKGMVQFNPFFRLSIEDCLAHPYFAKIRRKDREIKQDN
jgi:mitogen-activated protein kinase 1/3